MTRLTKTLNDNKSYIIDNDKITHDANGYSGDAINKLAIFENIFDDLTASQTEISEQLAKLRNEGKTHSAKFKELMVKKLTNANILILFKSYGLQ